MRDFALHSQKPPLIYPETSSILHLTEKSPLILPSFKEIEDVYVLRPEMEGLAAQLAAKKGSIAQFNKMDELLQLSERKIKQSGFIQNTDFLNSNNEFHDLIVEVSDNHALKNAFLQLRPGINLIRMMSLNRNSERLSMAIEQHKLILEAIMARDQLLVRKRTHDYVWDSVRLVLQSAKDMNNL